MTGPEATASYAVLASWDDGRDPRDLVLADMAAIGHVIRTHVTGS